MNDNDRNAQIEELLKEIRERREGAKSELTMDSYAKDVQTIQKEVKDGIKAQTKDYSEKIKDIKAETEKKEEAAERSQEAMAQTTLFDRRSVLNSIKREYRNVHEEEYDPINKSALAPTIERGVDVMPSHKSAGLLEQELEAEQEDVTYTENHSIFTDDAYVSDVIPEEEHKKAFHAKDDVPEETGSVILDAAAKKTQKKGVLNVKDNIDDNFREFFGNTVVIDKEPLDDKTKKQRKIKDFVFTDAESGISGGPVFEDDDSNAKKKKKDNAEVDATVLLEDLMFDAGRATLKSILSGIFAGILILLNIAQVTGLLSGTSLGSPLVFYAINAVVYLALFIVNAMVIFRGFVDVVSFRADSTSLVSFGAIISLLELVVLLFTSGESEARPVSACVMAVTVFMMTLGLTHDARRVSNSFSAMSEYEDKFASTVLADQSFTRKITKGLELSESKVLVKRRTSYTDNYLSHAENYDMISDAVSRTGSIMFIVSLLLGVVAYVKTSNIGSALAATAFAAVMCSPFVSTLSSSLPIGSIQKKLSKLGAYIPGYSAAEEIREANCIVISGRELFPKSNVKLHGIKTFEKERVDKAILYAASVLIKSCDTMAHMFLNVIQSKTEMLYEVDGVEYESNLGFSFWVDKDRILLGTREMIESHDIEVPSRDYENRYTKQSTRDAIYLAVGGKLYAMFVISYSPNEEVKNTLKILEADGLNVVVHTRDFNLSSNKISKIFGIPKKMISVVREDDVPELSKRTSYVKKTPSSLTHIGSLISLVNGISGCHRLEGSLRLSMTLELVCMISGAVLSTALVLFGNITAVGVLSALLFQILWTVILSVGVCSRKI